jgi:metallo-beta-lactamase family protein
MQLRAEVVSLDALSGHADQGELIEWMRPLAPRLKKVFLVHGELTQGAALAEVIRKEFKLEVQQPSRGHSFLLN